MHVATSTANSGFLAATILAPVNNVDDPPYSHDLEDSALANRLRRSVVRSERVA